VKQVTLSYETFTMIGLRWSCRYYDRFEMELPVIMLTRGGAYSEDIKYYDFKRCPELIPTVLEDFPTHKNRRFNGSISWQLS